MVARLTVQRVCKSFGATRALSGVGLQAQAGEIHAVIGENGAGKSTLMKILAGEISADQGTVLLDDKPFSVRSPAHAQRLGMSFVSQEIAVCPHMTVMENVLLGQEPTRWGIVDPAAGRREVRRALDRLTGSQASDWLQIDARVGDLPMAGRQWVEIARALVEKFGNDSLAEMQARWDLFHKLARER